MEVGYAIVRPDGKIQKVSTVLEGAYFQIYHRLKDAIFIRDHAYPGMDVVPVTLEPKGEKV